MCSVCVVCDVYVRVCPPTQHVQSPNGIGLEGLDRVVHVVLWGGGRGKVVDLVHCGGRRKGGEAERERKQEMSHKQGREAGVRVRVQKLQLCMYESCDCTSAHAHTHIPMHNLSTALTFDVQWVHYVMMD